MENNVYHTLDRAQLLVALESHDSGLSQEEVKKRQAKYGKNALPTRNNRSLISIVLSQFKSPFIYVLMGAALVAGLMGEYSDAGFICFVVFLNAGLGAYQEWKSELDARKMASFLVPEATVLREGESQVINSEELVPGDIIFLSSGSKVPADLSLLDVQSLEVDESQLTGESVAVFKISEPLSDPNLPLADRKNRCYAGSMVVSGRGKGLVTAIGSSTESGKLNQALLTSESSKTPLVLRMENFSTKLSYIVLVACLLVGFLAWRQGMELSDMFFLSVALAVSVIPEGLPISMTVALSISRMRMLKQNVIVKELTAVEGLGSCTAIATDKTGTLTVNKQTAKKVVLKNGYSLDIEGEGFQIEGNELKETNQELELLLTCFLLANEGKIEKEQQQEKGATHLTGSWKGNGDAMDIASLILAKKASLEKGEIESRFKTIYEVPYESLTMYAAKMVEDEKGTKMVFAKGALEILAKETDDLNYWHEQSGLLSDKGMRILAGVWGEYSGLGNPEELSSYNTSIIGIIGFIDPLRPEVVSAVELCKKAGIEVIMVTGDQPRTAMAIGKDLGIIRSQEQLVTGREMSNWSPEDVPKNIKGKTVFARVAPLQKLQLVEALMQNGHFVAVTGDGANDAPALKKANIGVAMGSGTDLAKDSSDLIIKDDNFSSIVKGVEEGRLAYSNIRKVIYLLLSASFAELFMFFCALIIGMPIPLTAIQILWLNVITNGIQDKALSLEKGGRGLMNRNPHSPKDGIFDRHMYMQNIVAGLGMGIVSFGLYFCLYYLTGYELNEARNLTLLTMVGLQNFHLFNARSEYGSTFFIPLSRNYYIIWSILLTQFIHLSCLFLPFMQDVLGTNPITFQEWLIATGLSLSIIPVVEVYKLFIHKFMNKVG